MSSKRLLQWMSDNGGQQEKVTLQTVNRQGVDIDVTVASQYLAPGDLALRIPEELIVSLDRVFEDGAVAELLTTNKLSELACLTLYLSYEKKRGKDSKWFPFIKELDRQAGRGPQGAKSPLLWGEGEVDELLAGSPVVGQIKERLRGIEKEYQELDTVWYMSGSLFKNYPFEIPTEQFSMEVFTQAFAAVQSSVVHLQGVPLSKRFALVPLGPPTMRYSSMSKALLSFNAEANEVQLVVDKAYAPGEPIVAWCGPQPNSRLLLNYGVVDEGNPYDKLPLGITMPSDDPLYREKRARLAEQDLSTQQTFQLSGSSDPIPMQLLPYLRLIYASSVEEMWAVRFGAEAAPVSFANETRVLAQLIQHLQRRLDGYKYDVEEYDSIIKDDTTGPRQTVAARLLRIEKGILKGSLEAIMKCQGAAEASRSGAAAGDAGGVLFL